MPADVPDAALVELTGIATSAATAAERGILTLPFESRQKARGRGKLDDGTDVVWRLPRGTALRDGTRLTAGDGHVVTVRAAAEALSEVHTHCATALARAAYHLGNRHVALAISAATLHYPRDRVLDSMVAGLGLTVVHVDAPFEPEAGAYAGAHGHAHD